MTHVAGFGLSTFTSDVPGNRRTKNGVAYGYHGATQRMTSDGAIGYTHDHNGNTKTAGGEGYDYSAFNMMTRATVAGVPTDYTYDADQQRRMRTGPGGTEYFIHGPGFVPLAEYKDVNGTLTWQRDYIYAGARLIASVAPATGGTPTYTFTDDPLVAGTTPAKGVHLTEVRGAVNSARAVWDLPAATWTDPTITAGATGTRALQITELRDALHAAYVAASATPPVYTDPSLTPDDPIKAVHLQELRAAVRALPAPAGGGLAYYHLDALGSVRAVTNATGAVVRRHDYLAFGEEFEPEAGSDRRRFTARSATWRRGWITSAPATIPVRSVDSLRLIRS